MKTEQLSFEIGNEVVYLLISIWGDSKVVYINLHENEQTSVVAGREVLSKNSGILIELRSKGERLISFTSGDQVFTFDPNRIFSSAGIRSTLTEYSMYDPDAERDIASLAAAVTKTILDYQPVLIVALHNTTGDYAIDNYVKGGKLENDMADIFVNPGMNNTELFFTTDQEAFNIIKEGAYNVVLQNNNAVTDDGSLSVYCAANGLRYINSEALHGHKNEQLEMITFLDKAFNK